MGEGERESLIVLAYILDIFNISEFIRLNRTPEFLIYGHGQQRRAVIESLRILDDEKHYNSAKLHDGVTDAVCFKEMSKKWQKFVTQVCLISNRFYSVF